MQHFFAEDIFIRYIIHCSKPKYLHSFLNAAHKMQSDRTTFAVSMGNRLQWLNSTAAAELKQCMSFGQYHSLHQRTIYQSQAFPSISYGNFVSLNNSLHLLCKLTNFCWKFCPNRRPLWIEWTNTRIVKNDTKMQWYQSNLQRRRIPVVMKQKWIKINMSKCCDSFSLSLSNTLTWAKYWTLLIILMLICGPYFFDLICLRNDDSKFIKSSCKSLYGLTHLMRAGILSTTISM